jgi:biopolymer transport protein ExbD
MARNNRREELESAGEELNLIPYMDIMVNLVLFMLVSITSFLSFTILNASIPQLDTNASQTVTEAQKKEDLLLILHVNDKGYTVEANVTGGKPIGKKVIPKTTIEGQEGKGYDTQALTDHLATIKERFQEEDKILIIADAAVEYENIIKTMDATRETDVNEEDLFTEMTLSI